MGKVILLRVPEIEKGNCYGCCFYENSGCQATAKRRKIFGPRCLGYIFKKLREVKK